MQFALVSDVHGNLEALEVVLAAIDAHAPDARIVCAGDVVGYGPDPEACLDLLQARQAVIVMGNHEEMVLGIRDFSHCVHAGVTAALWTRRQLAPAVRSTLEQLPGWADAGPGLVVCHGDLEDANNYVANADTARTALGQLQRHKPGARGLICGHTHHATFYTETTGFVPIRGDRTVELPADEPFLVNPGAVGQSRDGTVHASYAVIDLARRTVAYHSLPYDSGSTIAKLRRARLVAQVVLERPQGVARRVENTKLRVARWRARTTPHVPSSPGRRPPVTAPRTASRLGVVARGVRRSGAPAAVLAYRAITTPAEADWVDPRSATPLTVFEKQMEWLARHRRPVSLTELLEQLDRGTLQPGTVVVTFDEAHRTVVDHAVPILHRLGLPATVYVATRPVSEGSPANVDELYALFTWRTRNVLEVAELGPRPISLYDVDVVRATYLALHERLVPMTWDERRRLLSDIRAQLQPRDDAPRLTAGWDELRKARELHPGVHIGVATRSSVDLSSCDAATAGREILDSVSDVRDALGVEALDLAYPFGRHNFTARAAVAATGLRSAVVLDAAAHVGPETDRLAIPRRPAPNEASWFGPGV